MQKESKAVEIVEINGLTEPTEYAVADERSRIIDGVEVRPCTNCRRSWPINELRNGVCPDYFCTEAPAGVDPSKIGQGVVIDYDELSYDEPELRLEHAAETLASDIANAAGIDPDYEAWRASL